MAHLESVSTTEPGAALLSNTTLCEASRLLVGRPRLVDRKERRGAALAILDLMSTIDACVLYEQLFTLPATLSTDADSLALRCRLVDAGVVRPLPRTDDLRLVGQALLNVFETVDDRAITSAHDKPSPVSFADYGPVLAEELGVGPAEVAPLLDGPVAPLPHQQEGYDASIVSGMAPSGSGADSFALAAREVAHGIERSFSGAYESSMESVRAMFYVFAAEHYKVPYWPSASVAPIARRFPNYFSGSSRTEIYRHVSAVLHATIDDLAKEFQGAPAFIPPFSAIVLDRASGPDQVPDAVIDVREQYAAFRGAMLALEQQRRDARSIADRLEVTRQIQFLCSEASKPYTNPRPMVLESTLRVIPDMTELATNATAPSAWVTALVSKPAEWLILWYRRRPIRKLLRTAHQVVSLDDYGNLLDKHFGAEAMTAVGEHAGELTALEPL